MIVEICNPVEKTPPRFVPAHAGVRQVRRTADDVEECARELLTMAAHDLCSPLAGIRLRAVAVADRWQAGEEPSPSELVSAVIYMRRAADEACALIDDLLAVERVTRRGTPAPALSTDIVGVIREVIGQQREALTRARSRVRVLGPKGIDRLRGPWDRGYLLRVFGNLLRNAVLHAPGAPIQIVLARQGDTLRILFADGGPGLRARADREEPIPPQSGNTDGANHGLGLWIVRRAVERLGGRLRIRNSPGQGVAFDVELPDLEDQRAIGHAGATARKGQGSPRRPNVSVRRRKCA